MADRQGMTSTLFLPALATHEVVRHRGARRTLALIAFVVATSLAAQVAVPLPWTQVPMTLQPLLVLLAGALLGPWLGASAMAAYLAVGLLGAPVFAAGGAGIGWLMGPTGGYLISYPAVAFLVGFVMGERAGPARTASALALGMAAIYLGGVSQLLILTGQDLSTVLGLGVLPFLLGDLTKVVIALVVVRTARAGSLGRL